MLITTEATNIDQPAKESARREEKVAGAGPWGHWRLRGGTGCQRGRKKPRVLNWKTRFRQKLVLPVWRSQPSGPWLRYLRAWRKWTHCYCSCLPGCPQPIFTFFLNVSQASGNQNDSYQLDATPSPKICHSLSFYLLRKCPHHSPSCQILDLGPLFPSYPIPNPSAGRRRDQWEWKLYLFQIWPHFSIPRPLPRPQTTALIQAPCSLSKFPNGLPFLHCPPSFLYTLAKWSHQVLNQTFWLPLSEFPYVSPLRLTLMRVS